MNRHSIVTRIFLPFVLTTMMFAVVLLGLVPDRQAKILAANSENELFSIAKTIALTVNIALEKESLEALAEFNTFLKNDAHISVAGIFVNTGDSFELLAAFPSEVESELVAGVDPKKFLVASAPFETSNLSGYIEVGFSREEFASQLQAINLILYIAFIAILVLQIIVYRVVQLGVIRPILASIKSADALGAGNLDTSISKPSGQGEIAQLLGALIQLQNNLRDQKTKNEELTTSLEYKVSERTEELSSALHALESAQKTTNAVIDSSFDAIVLLDKEGRIHEWNSRASRMFGLSREESINESMPQLLLNEQHVERFYTKGVFDAAPLSNELIELTGHTKGKAKIDLQGFITALQVDQQVQWAVFLRDITINKSISDAINNQRIVGSSVLDGLPIGVSLESRMQDQVLQNEAYRKLEEQGFTEFDSGTETERRESTWEQGASGPWDLVLSSEEETRTFIGAMRIIEPDIADQERYLLRYLVDVTELKEQEKKLREALASKDAFVSAITHELRTPLHSIVACLDLISTTQRPDDIDALQYVSVAQSSSETLLSLINELLDFQKAVERDLQLVNEPFQLFALFQQSSNMCHILFEGTSVNFNSEFEGDERLRLVGDARRITQLITNIVGNARKFSQQGEVAMTIDCQPHSSGSFVLRFKITDTGIGMDQKTLTHLGEPFYQGATGFSREFGGTGLGLSIVKQILSAMNSELVVESTLGVGSSFSFELRLPAASAVEIEEVEPSTHPLPSKQDAKLDYSRSGLLNVMYVEDADTNRLVMKAMMAKFPVALTMAKSAMEGLTLARENQFDLIITDIQMPFHTGIELRQWLADDVEIHAPHIIAFTANAGEARREEYLNIGFNDVITKPLTLAKLGGFLKTYLDAL
jgi:PAS domain S-box-containing protein